MPDTEPKFPATDAELVEEVQVTAEAGFPPRVILEILTADRKVSRFVFGPMMAHKVSDDLLRGVAAVKRSDPPEGRGR